MTHDFFALLVLGHLVGDYLAQTKKMAMNKDGNAGMCAFHCLLYTAIVALFTFPVMHNYMAWPVLIFCSHFVIDYYSVADLWLELIEGRSLKDYLANGKKNIPKEMDQDNYHALRGGFTALVYAVADNTMHLVSMYFFAMTLM